jgi:2-polyprenyl-3-methyl-5-hydroxy-6-metoxy-1,4-benzoquinol methylase
MENTKIPSDERIAIGLPRGADTGFKYEFIESLFMLFGYSPCNYKMISVDKVHHHARNEIITNFLSTDMNYLLFIDSDMIWEPDSLELAYNLIQHPMVDIVTGIYYTKGAPHLPVIKKLDLEAGCYNIFVEWGNQPFEVDGAGMGFMLIPRYVLEKMKNPYCTWDGGFSEDLNFCLKAKKDHGFKIWAHPGIKLGHIGNKIITNFDYMQQFKPGIKAYIREAMVGTKKWLKETYPTWREDLGIHPLQFKNINTQEYWDKIYNEEGGTDKNWRRYPEKFDFIVNRLLMNIEPDAKVLELGCGVGVFAQKLKAKYPSVSYYGIDISQVAIDELKKAGFEGHAQEVPPIKVADKPDLVLGFEFLEHLDEEPRLKTIKEVSSLIGENGRAIFSLPDDCMSPEEVSEHRVKYDKQGFEKFLKKAFSNVSVHQIASRPSEFSPGTFDFLIADCSNKKKRYFKSNKKGGENDAVSIQK